MDNSNKSKTTYLENVVLVSDSNTNGKLVIGYLVLQGYNWTVSKSKYGEGQILRKSFNNKIDLFVVNTKVQKSTDGTFEVWVFIYNYNVHLISFWTKEKDAQIIINHFNMINEKINTVREKYKELTIEALKTSGISSDVEHLLMGFISDSPKELFINKHYLLSLYNKLLFEFDYDGKNILDYKSEYIKYVLELYKNKSAWESLENFIKDKFNLFCNIIDKKFIFTGRDDCVFTTLYLLKIYSIVYYAEYWEHSHKDVFKKINESTLEECVNKYCHIETIDKKSEINIGIFTYFLMKNEKIEYQYDYVKALLEVETLMNKEVSVNPEGTLLE